MTVVLLGATVYISTLLLSPSPPTQIQKTKAAAVTYKRNVILFPTGVTAEPTASPVSPTKALTITITPTTVPSVTKVPIAVPTKTSALLAQAPTLTPAPTSVPTKIPIVILPTAAATPLPTPTLQPLLAYKSTSITPTIAPTLIPVTNTNTPSPTKKAQPTGVQQLPETGWIQISSILFIVATSTILFSLLF